VTKTATVTQTALAEHLLAAILREWPDVEPHKKELDALLVESLTNTDQDVYTYSSNTDVPVIRLVHEDIWDMMDAYASEAEPASGAPATTDLIVAAPGTTGLRPGRWRIRR
jgi:hypothetical protein